MMTALFILFEYNFKFIFVEDKDSIKELTRPNAWKNKNKS